MIEIKDLKKGYGRKLVLDIPELVFNKGEIIGIVGNNGAGKTTLFSLVLDLIQASTGAVYSKGKEVSKDEAWKKYTAAFIDEGFLIGFLSPDEYFEFIGQLFDWSKATVHEFTAEFEEIFNDEIRGKKKYIRDLSKGNQKKVGLVASLIGGPEVLIWDEPFSNLDPSTQLRVRNLITKYAENRTFLISSHDLNHIADVCTRIIILEKGKIIKDVQKEDISKEELVDFFIPDDINTAS
jgi:ABC-2 type transport system ATP-binding protein